MGNWAIFYYLYGIKNNLNGKIYIGVHKTKNIDDGYMGSGLVIKRAIAKYGVENFTKTILERFDSSAEMLRREREVVDSNFLSREDTYNLMRGGHGGFDFINTSEEHSDYVKLGRSKADVVLEELYGSNWRSVLASMSVESRKSRQSGFFDPNCVYSFAHNKTFQQAGNTPEARAKASATMKHTAAVIGHQRGEKNSNYGKRWITDGVISKTILRTEPIPEGFKPGRTGLVSRQICV